MYIDNFICFVNKITKASSVWETIFKNQQKLQNEISKKNISRKSFKTLRALDINDDQEKMLCDLLDLYLWLKTNEKKSPFM